MKSQIISYTVMAHWLPAIVNDDLSGIDNQDDIHVLSLLDRVQEDCPENHTFGHFATTEDCDEFGLCEICNLRGSVERLEAVYWENGT